MYEDFTSFFVQIWQHQPVIIVLLVGGLLLVPLIIIDTHRHRKNARKIRDRGKHHH